MKQLAGLSLAKSPTPSDLEAVRRSHHDAIEELQKHRNAGSRFIASVTLADGVATPIAHGLGRPAFVTHTPPRGASSTGRIEEVRDGTQDRSKFVVLKATGWGATITIDIEAK